MKPIGFPLLAAVSLLSTTLPGAWAAAATRPHYGGTLQVEMRARVDSLDPRQWPADATLAAAKEKLASPVFEPLVRLDEHGQPQPSLAIAWEHDAECKQWKLRLRPGVKFHDGSALTASAVAAALGPLFASVPKTAGERRISFSGEWLIAQSDRPWPNLLTELARRRNLIYRVTENGVVGTGPFRVAQWQPGRRLVVTANEDCWAGRPYLDSIIVEMGVNARQQLVDLELAKADVVELRPDQLRRSSETGVRSCFSSAVDLLALVFDLRRPAVQEPRLRQALALAIDRAAIVNVLLQKHGEPAGGLLPQWLSGYAFLFPTAADTERARQLTGGGRGSPVPTLGLVYDSEDEVVEAIAERIRVNAREVGIRLQVPAPSVKGGLAPRSASVPADVHLTRFHLSATDARGALESLARSVEELSGTSSPARASSLELNGPEQLYTLERALLSESRVIPLVHLPETYGLSARVKNWVPLPWGDWRLDDVWLDASSVAPASGGKP